MEGLYKMTPFMFELISAILAIIGAVTLFFLGDTIWGAASAVVIIAFESNLISQHNDKPDSRFVILGLGTLIVAYVIGPPMILSIGFVGFFMIFRFMWARFFYTQQQLLTEAVEDAKESVNSILNREINELKGQLSHSISEEEFQCRVTNLRRDLEGQYDRERLNIEREYARREQEIRNDSSAEKTAFQLKKLLEQKENELQLLKADEETRISRAVEKYQKELQRKNIELSNSKKELRNTETALEKSNIEIERLKAELHAQQDEFIADREKTNSQSNQLIHNTQLNDTLIKAMEDAKEELDIMSPWISHSIVDEDRFQQMIGRGVVLKIIYGIENKEARSKKRDHRLEEAEEILLDLQRKYGRGKIRTEYFSSHSKLILCDEQYYVITSCNILSNKGSNWEEIGEISTNKENIQAYRYKYFRF